MANGLTPEQTSQLSRSGIRKLIKTYNDSNQQDKATLSLIIEQLARTSLYFIVEKDSDPKTGTLRFVTLSTGGQVFIPMFTGPDDFGALADRGKAVCLEPESYLRMLLENNCHAVINPFGSYFLMWPEFIKTTCSRSLSRQKTSPSRKIYKKKGSPLGEPVFLV